MAVPDGMDVKVVENADNCVHITMPADPSGSKELSDEELSHAAGGYAPVTPCCQLDSSQ
jgi:mersacidin/lichenicidin family type 2 lantibiotic